ncbi:MAG TPA: nucleotide sugar dehydrogenase [Azospirillaceae bacterium]|nr:nucleotide sugar dehydrogenase [Azospirillaceae bacterium]
MLPKSYRDRNICVLGLGYVGLTLATAMADAGFRVHGVEIRDEVLDKLASGDPHFHEPGLPEKLKSVIGRGQFTFGKAPDARTDASVYIITVGTPLNACGRVRTDMVEAAARQVAEVLREGDMVIMRSTVKLGTTRAIVMPTLAATCRDFDIAVCPERTLEGKALVELTELPQIVGGLTPESSARAAQMFSFLTPTTVKVASLETAELIKLVDNTYRDVVFAFSNEIARVCDRLEISAAEVVRAGKLGYPRTNLALPGPVGGPCLEKDPHILAESAAQFGVTLDITPASRRVNERQPVEIAHFLRQLTSSLQGFPERPVITLMGLAFKGRPATDDLRGTMAKPVFEALKAGFPNAIWRGYDAVVSADGIHRFGLKPAASLEDALSGAHLAVILNNHPVFAAMPVAQLAETMERPGIIYDFWNNFTSFDLQLPEGTSYVALGSHGRASFAHVA